MFAVKVKFTVLSNDNFATYSQYPELKGSIEQSFGRTSRRILWSRIDFSSSFVMSRNTGL